MPAREADPADELRRGLLMDLPEIPSKHFYDDEGSRLFEAITRLPEYYPTRTEETILEAEADRILDLVGPRALAELGSGAGRKIRALLDAMVRRGVRGQCLQFDINRSFVEASVRRLQDAYPSLEIRGEVGDFLHDLHQLGPGGERLILFFAGTIGNFTPAAATRLVRDVAGHMAPGDGFLVGFDLVKDVARLEAAYDDAAGVTAAFNRNILAVVNRRFDADFDPGAFRHVAFYDRTNDWIEMRLRASRAMRVDVRGVGLVLDLAEGDEIRTEISCKYTRPRIEAMARAAGLAMGGWFTDPEGLFALALLRR
jgi:L-histidine N-alpha-methyltransferase